MSAHFTLPKQPIETFRGSSSNRITKDYYNFLVGAINNGLVHKAVVRIENKIFGTESYYLISQL